MHYICLNKLAIFLVKKIKIKVSFCKWRASSISRLVGIKFYLERKEQDSSQSMHSIFNLLFEHVQHKAVNFRAMHVTSWGSCADLK